MKCRMPDPREVIADQSVGCMVSCDLAYMLALHELEGYGHDRMLRVMKKAGEIYAGFRDRYCAEGDQIVRNDREPHLIAMREELKAVGFDYDYEIRRMEQEQKHRWRGNKVLGR